MNPSSPSSRAWASFLLGAPVFGALIYFAATRLHTFPPWAVFVAIFVLTALIMLPGIYTATLARIHDNALFNRTGWLYRLRSRRLLITLRWFLWGLASAYFMLLQLNLYTRAEWFLFFLNFPLFLVVFLAARHLLRKHANPLHALRFAIAWTRWLLPVTMALLAGLALWQTDASRPASTLQETIAAKRAHMSGVPSSAVVDESLRIVSLFGGLKDHAEKQAASLSATVGKILAVLSAAVVSFNVSLLLSCLVIPAVEYRRLFGAMSDDPVPPPVPAPRVATFVAIVTVLSLFIFLQGFAALEAHLQKTSTIPDGRVAVEKVLVELIDGDLYRSGTIDQIERAREELLRRLAAEVPGLERQIDAAFLAMEANVDSFLDWYYSLPAEYMRLGAILTGGLETMLQERLREHLGKGDAFNSVEERLRTVIANQQAALDKFNALRDRLLASNRLDAVGHDYQVVRSARLKDLSRVPTPPVHIDAASRLGGAGAAGAVTGIVAAKVVSKAVAKGILKMAAKAVAKVAASKAASSAAGAAAGAAIGTLVVPGIGTAIGGAVGFVIGLASGIAVDAGLLALEEQLSRAEFRKQIMASIAEARSEFKKNVFASQ